MTPAMQLRPQLAGAAEWRLLALLLSRPRGGWAEQISALAGEAPEDLRSAAERAHLASEGAYHALLGPGAAASPREAAHAGFVDPGRILADLAERYDAFAFRSTSEEPPDHLAVECDYVSYLFLKEAYALAGGAAAAAEIAREERTRFIEEHVAIAARGLGRKLSPHAPEYLVRAARALSERVPETPAAPAAAPSDDPLEGGCPGSCTVGCTR